MKGVDEMLKISEAMGDESEQRIMELVKLNLRVCLPCIVDKVDTVQQTVDVQPLIREQQLDENNKPAYINYPLLINVPIVFPCAGDYAITLPVQKGDECLVIFSDLSYDNWWVSGGVQNPVEQRRHDLSDGFAVFGLRNQRKRLSDYSGNKLKLYNIKAGTGIEVDSEGVKILGNVEITGNVQIHGNSLIQGDSELKGAVLGQLTAQGVNLVTHTHTGAHGQTGGPQ